MMGTAGSGFNNRATSRKARWQQAWANPFDSCMICLKNRTFVGYPKASEDSKNCTL
jgi:hypothetical protein